MDKLSGTTRHGFSLMEFVMGSALLLVFFAAFSVFFRSASHTNAGHAAAMSSDLKLQAVAEKIRYETSANFDFMTETNRDRSDNDKQVQITSTISALDPITQSRNVTLKASWFESGVRKEKISTFTIRRGKARMLGAQIKVRVVNQLDGSPVSGISVSAQGQDSPLSIGSTDVNGICTLLDVRIEGKGVIVTVDGQAVRHYFNDSPPTYAKKFPSGPTEPNKVTVLPDIEIRAPALISGRVTDEQTGNPVAGAVVEIIASEPIIPFTSQDKVTTSTAGIYYFPAIPGTYGVYLLGSPYYSGLSRSDEVIQAGTPPDASPQNIYSVDPTHMGVTKVIDFSTRRLADVYGTLKGITWDPISGKYVPMTTTVSNMPMKISNYYLSVWRPSNPWGNAWETRAANDYWLDPVGNGLPDVNRPFTTDAYGKFAVSRVGPGIMESDTDHDNQGMTYWLAPTYTGGGLYIKTPAPWVPVIVQHDPDTGIVNFMQHQMATYGVNVVYHTAERDISSGIQSFSGVEGAYVIKHGQDVTRDFYLLHRSALGQVNFNIINDETGAGWTGTARMVTHWGAFDIDSAGYASSPILTLVVPTTYYVTTTAIPSLSTGDVTAWFASSYYSYPGTGNTVVTKYVEARRNVSGSTATLHTSIFDINIPAMTVDGYKYGNPGALQWTNTNPVTNGVWNSANNSTGYSDLWSGVVVPYVVPGSKSSVDVRMKRSRVWSNPYSYNARAMSDWQVYGTSQCPQTYYYDNLISTSGGFTSNRILMMHIGTSPRIFGRVVDTNGVAIPGATITVWRSGVQPIYQGVVPPSKAPYQDLTFTTVNDACSWLGISCAGGPYQYMFTDVKFIEHRHVNLRITISAPGYTTYSEALIAYDGMEWQRDFMLQKTYAPASAGDL